MLASGTKTSATTGLQFTNPTMQGITAGSAFNVTWEGANGTTTLTLQNGTSNSINTVDIIAFGITDPFLVWSPYVTTPASQYVLRLDDEGGASAYSGMFDMVVKNSGVAVVTTTVSTSPTSTSTSSSSSSSSSSSTQSPAAASTTATTSPTPSSTSSSSLSTGAKVGIAIGAVLGALAIVGVVAFFLLHRNKKSPASPSTPTETTPFGTSHYSQDLNMVGKAEIEAKVIPVEISGGQERLYEMGIDDFRILVTEKYFIFQASSLMIGARACRLDIRRVDGLSIAKKRSLNVCESTTKQTTRERTLDSRIVNAEHYAENLNIIVALKNTPKNTGSESRVQTSEQLLLPPPQSVPLPSKASN
ncbi:uncharacterized protein PAC_06886 [Phialocephala subalpina]|uniref:Yeast cell wall synthesis Kre9/Knh1-like N-terminal domain-containing protein n=1 Tax=Phialocephala subalpina TaxID=576137 RepID=A0A1L7WW38_9HELO|nr:uncharacterized protein PAC_06886 [Phialocephala subalpina]